MIKGNGMAEKSTEPGITQQQPHKEDDDKKYALLTLTTVVHARYSSTYKHPEAPEVAPGRRDDNN